MPNQTGNHLPAEGNATANFTLGIKSSQILIMGKT